MNKYNNHTLLLRKFHALLGQAGLRAEKDNMLSGYGVESSKDLTDDQLAELCTTLEDIVRSKNEAAAGIRRRRSVVITLLEALGVYKNDAPDRWSRVNKYLLQPRICGKLLYQLNEEELDALARKLRAIHKQLVQRIQEERYQASNN